MIVKDSEAVTRMVTRLHAILEQDKKVSQYEKDCIWEAIQALEYVVLDDKLQAYPSRVADDTD